ncbi:MULTISPECIES: maleylpyruvate isomerase family mycothiol-dependent enzyme [unclassified Luteococcus]|uniref:maleylpyruvate isomerase family mycothiol-dependent enzyme n=1 Tax=unclassified Luteococcus TaxID=2639923 RepID=UPI00313B8EAD
MTSEPPAPLPLPVSATTATLRRRKLEATQALLGDTISIPDEDWQQPSRLPGWTRAHVATHLARNADAMRQVVEGLLGNRPTPLYPSPRQRRRDLEVGSRRAPLELQIDLDTSAGQLNQAFTRLTESGRVDVVELGPCFRMPAPHLMVARLNEVVLHRIDLDHGFTAAHVDADIARWLLEWNCQRIGERPDFPALHLMSDSGFQATIGAPPPAGHEAHLVHGTDASLLGWLTSRGPADSLGGADGLTLPEL